jgi:hypothetical protein
MWRLGAGLADPFMKPDAGMTLRRDLNAERKIGFSTTVSARALNVEGSSLSGFFHHDGTSPQRIGTSSLPPPAGRMTSTLVVGAML